ncbi:MAG TPA: hypothetical protein VLB84_03085 [Bacteroidia bacterium]|nr:hypothetical protein [Bacteroidia bacterium]
MNELKIGDEVYIRNFENQKLTVSSFDKENVTCIYLNSLNEFKSIQVAFALLVHKNFSPVLLPGKKSRRNEKAHIKGVH